MFKLSEIRDLIKLLDQTSIHVIEIENENGKILIKKPEKAEPAVIAPPQQMILPQYVDAMAPYVQQLAPVVAPPAPVAPAPAADTPSTPSATPVADDPSLHKIVSPMVGTFYPKPAPGKPSYVEVGSRVSNETTVCIIEAMKLMNELTAEVSGEIVKILVEDGQLVEYGQPLFLVKKDG